MKLHAIVAMSENRVIGVNNQLPWQLPADLKHVRETTTGHALLMGRKTYESIGRPLPNRENIVLTRNPDFQAPGCIIVSSLEEAIEKCQSEILFIFGGEALFKMYLDKVNQLHLTIIHHHFDGDTFFPELDMDNWELVSEDAHKADEKNAYDYTFYVYRNTSLTS